MSTMASMLVMEAVISPIVRLAETFFAPTLTTSLPSTVPPKKERLASSRAKVAPSASTLRSIVPPTLTKLVWVAPKLNEAAGPSPRPSKDTAPVAAPVVLMAKFRAEPLIVTPVGRPDRSRAVAEIEPATPVLSIMKPPVRPVTPILTVPAVKEALVPVAPPTPTLKTLSRAVTTPASPSWS